MTDHQREPTDADSQTTAQTSAINHSGDPTPYERQPELVICFDRDRTVSVNPPPRSGDPAVPLAWVKYLAHDERATAVDVWATGNQQLCEEAMIPGTAEAVAYWSQYGATHTDRRANDESVTAYPGLDREPPRPCRRDRLRLIADLYGQPQKQAATDTEQTQRPVFVVVDDVELKDLSTEGFAHFLPWMFCVLTEDTGGQPAVFEPVDVSLPLAELPSAGDNRATTDTDPNSRESFAYTNEPYTATDDAAEPPPYYDPARREGTHRRQ